MQESLCERESHPYEVRSRQNLIFQVHDFEGTSYHLSKSYKCSPDCCMNLLPCREAKPCSSEKRTYQLIIEQALKE